jgi:SAM-dependent methyltransferase
MLQGTEIYDESADELSDYYDRIGPRYGDIELAFADAGNPENPVVLEIGCGNGRDAEAITNLTPYYTGIDSSEKMLVKAQDRLPNAHFEQADARTYDYSGTYDIVFAFAPFRHLDLDDVTVVLRKIYDSLRVGGVLYMSSNYGEKYEEAERVYPYGVQKIYRYNPLIIQKHAPHGFKKIREQKDDVNNEAWFELSLRKTI